MSTESKKDLVENGARWGYIEEYYEFLTAYWVIDKQTSRLWLNSATTILKSVASNPDTMVPLLPGANIGWFTSQHFGSKNPKQNQFKSQRSFSGKQSVHTCQKV